MKNSGYVKRIRILSKTLLKDLNNHSNNDIQIKNDSSSFNTAKPNEEEPADLIIPSIKNKNFFSFNYNENNSSTPYSQQNSMTKKKFKLNIPQNPLKPEKSIDLLLINTINKHNNNKNSIIKVDTTTQFKISTLKNIKYNKKDLFKLNEPSIKLYNKDLNIKKKHFQTKKIFMNEGLKKKLKYNDIYQYNELFLLRKLYETKKIISRNDLMNNNFFVSNSASYSKKIIFPKNNVEEKISNKKLSFCNKYGNNIELKTKNDKGINNCTSYCYLNNNILEKRRIFSSISKFRKKFHDNVKIKTFIDLFRKNN